MQVRYQRRDGSTRHTSNSNLVPEVKVVRALLVQLPRIEDPRGNLSVVESGLQVPFETPWVQFHYDLAAGETQLGHAHKTVDELIIAASGSFRVVVHDGPGHREEFYLNRSYYGLHVPCMVWHQIEGFSSGSVCLVLSSGKTDNLNSYWNYNEFLGFPGRTQ